MKKAYSIILSLFLIFGLATAGCKARDKAASGEQVNPLATPEETVKKFLDLDAVGTRLSSTTWPKVLPYISWQEEPGWDSVVVISGYKITKTVKPSPSAARVTVDYVVLGKIVKDYVEERAVRTVNFTVKKTGAGWKIKDPDFILPHVLPKPLTRHLEDTKNLELAAKVKEAAKE